MPTAKPSTCKDCSSYSVGTGFAAGEGPIPADIMFIGEALGETEANEGRPFRGGTGKMLRIAKAQHSCALQIPSVHVVYFSTCE